MSISGRTRARRKAFLATGIGLVLAGGLAGWRYAAAHREPMLTRPLLQDADGQEDNSVCLVCHIDLEAEEMVVAHLDAGIVCANCHGASEEHRSDELNITPPQVLYGRADIGPFCKACHPKHKTGRQYDIFVKQWLGRRRPNGRMITADSTCTDCHGNHVILPPELIPTEDMMEFQ